MIRAIPAQPASRWVLATPLATVESTCAAVLAFELQRGRGECAITPFLPSNDLPVDYSALDSGGRK
jgi:hypothetical protein